MSVSAPRQTPPPSWPSLANDPLPSGGGGAALRTTRPSPLPKGSRTRFCPRERQCGGAIPCLVKCRFSNAGIEELLHALVRPASAKRHQGLEAHCASTSGGRPRRRPHCHRCPARARTAHPTEAVGQPSPLDCPARVGHTSPETVRPNRPGAGLARQARRRCGGIAPAGVARADFMPARTARRAASICQIMP
jgi:hypothetical protein